MHGDGQDAQIFHQFLRGAQSGINSKTFPSDFKLKLYSN